MKIKDLKKIIQNLPDNMDVMGYNGGNGNLYCIDHWVNEEESEEYPNGTLVISVD
jgi:hypothetical protein